MLLLTCKGCAATAMVPCTCPPEMADLPFHAPGCPTGDPDAQLICAPGSSCCADSHGGLSHGKWASTCPGGSFNHPGEPCPAPDTCGVWHGMARAVADLDPGNPQHMAVKAELEAMYGRPVAGPCPGGHCARGVAGCRVCRPITVSWIGGGVRMRPVTA